MAGAASRTRDAARAGDYSWRAADSCLTTLLNSEFAFDAAKGAARTVTFASDAAPDRDLRNAIISAISIDAQEFHRGLTSKQIARAPLWLDRPPWPNVQWGKLTAELRRLGTHWVVWIDWYQYVWNGSPPAAGWSEAREMAFVDLPEPLPWDDGPKAVNTEIGARLMRISAKAPAPGTLIHESAPSEEIEPDPDVQREIFDHATGTEADSRRQASSIPNQRPAAVEPIWKNGALTLPKRSAKTDITRRQFAAALKGLGAELRSFADDIANEANIDRRFVAHLRSLAERIPQKTPRQDELFRIGHIEAVFEGYAKTVNDQWPEFLAAQYHALALHFDRTMRQSPDWREFKRNAAKQSLTAPQMAAAVPLAIGTSHALRNEAAQEFVDPIVPDALQHLAACSGSTELPPDDSGEELIAVDLIESTNNILKRIAEGALTVARPAKSTFVKAGSEYAKGAEKGFVRAAKKQGPIDGERAFKWLRRVVLYGGSSAACVTFGLPPLMAKFPEAFAWLERILH